MVFILILWQRGLEKTEPNRTEFSDQPDRPPRTADYWCHLTAVEKWHVASEETCSSGLISTCTGSNYCLCNFSHTCLDILFSFVFPFLLGHWIFILCHFLHEYHGRSCRCLLLSWDSPWNGCSDMEHIKGARDQELAVFFTWPSFSWCQSDFYWVFLFICSHRTVFFSTLQQQATEEVGRAARDVFISMPTGKLVFSLHLCS